MYDLKKRRFKILLIGVVLALILVSGLVYINISVNNRLSAITRNNLGEILSQQTYNFSTKIKDDMKLVNTIADFITISNFTLNETADVFNDFIQDTPFDTMLIVDKAKHGIDNFGVEYDLEDRDYLNNIFEEGNTVISKPLLSKKDNTKSIMIIASPVFKNGEVTSVVVGTYDANKLRDVFLPSFNGKGYTFVANTEGDLITQTSNSYTVSSSSNLFDDLEQAEFYNGSSLEKIKSDVSSGTASGEAQYNYNGNMRAVSYAPSGVNDWYTFNVVPENVITEESSTISANMYFVSMIFMCAFLIVILYIMYLQKKHVTQLSHVAYTDELTGASNLLKFKEDAYVILKENTTLNYCIIKFDIHHFKVINELYGFKEGDRVLKKMAETLNEVLMKKTDIFARVSSDEFIILYCYKDDEGLQQKHKDIFETFARLNKSVLQYKVSLSIGRYLIQKGEYDIDSIFEKVNYAHRKSKTQRDFEICDYDQQIKDSAIREKEIEDKMEYALENGEFKVYMQPKYYLKGEILAGAEALVRWQNNDKTIVYPDSFIPQFEKNGFITKLDMYIFESVCKIIRSWLDNDITPVKISVNFSRNHLNNPDFVKEICAIAKKWSIPTKFLEAELTETAIFDNETVMKLVLKDLHAAGFTLSMDDFGTGYSSLGLLKNLSVDVIKIDRSFFTEADDSNRAKKVIENVIRLAKELNIETVAEGVETEKHIALLSAAGCNIVQGYYYSRPMPHEEFTIKLI